MTESFQLSPLIETDVLIVGGGPGGLAAAIGLAAAGAKVICVERAAPSPEAAQTPEDLRTAAILAPSAAFLRRLGLWDALIDGATPRATALATMRVIDDGPSRGARAGADVAFAAAEIDQPAFGWNIATADLRQALWDAAAETPGLTLMAPAAVAHLALRDDAVRATLSDGRRIAARLVIGADGRRSAVRDALGIGARRLDLGQTAMVFHVAHDQPHNQTSTEIYRQGGPFTLVPHGATPDHPQRSAVVWMTDSAAAAGLMALGPDAFIAKAEERSLGVLGPLRLITERRAWPVITLLADRFHGPRAALIAEAAHVAPPIGAQGLNMSFRDAEVLIDQLAPALQSGGDVGAPAPLKAYDRARRPDVSARLAAATALDAAAIGALAPIRDIRALGLKAMGAAAPLKRAAMRFGLGG